jgi:NAD(P)H-flavin reductase
MADTYFFATVEKSWDETPALRGIGLRLPHDAAQHHRAPGQVVKLRVPAGESYFALANAPDGNGSCELLVKRGSPVSDAVIAAAQPGAPIETTAPFGKGFPLAEAHGKDLFLFAGGSGITPLRAVVQEIRRRRGEFGHTALFYGQRADEDFAYKDEHAEWDAAGIRVVLCASRPSDSWDGHVGYVQDVAHSLAFLDLDLGKAVAFLCGTKQMVTDVRAVLAKAGVSGERTFLNF